MENKPISKLIKLVIHLVNWHSCIRHQEQHRSSVRNQVPSMPLIDKLLNILYKELLSKEDKNLE
jgi:hypothetical protein